ncbi:hypothetical protein [Pseudoxanthomonas sp. Root630]|uniref:hypothetical protein n=1 Tax=Pseudoxanthomonas sp. Root630 TaxID=1736574 RepID=UPI000A9E3D55|nr:hypothetical protein [Pseudoxanthomonas sp. Root630]
MMTPTPSSQRTLGSTSIFAKSPPVDRMQGNIKMDPGVRRDGEPEFDAYAVRKVEVAAT